MVAETPSPRVGTRWAPLAQALFDLIEVCDGAETVDGRGFSSAHAERARTLARKLPAWDHGDAKAAGELLASYREQLVSLGHTLTLEEAVVAGPEAEVALPAELFGSAYWNSARGVVSLVMDYEFQAARETLKRWVPGCYYEGVPGAWQVVPDRENAKVLLAYLDASFLTVEPGARAACKKAIESEGRGWYIADGERVVISAGEGLRREISEELFLDDRSGRVATWESSPLPGEIVRHFGLIADLSAGAA